MKPKDWNHWKTLLEQKCYPCVQYNLQPMCPVWTEGGWRE